MTLHHLRVALDLGAEGAPRVPPAAFRIFAAGAVTTTKGVFLFDAKAGADVLAAAADWGNDFPVDYCHAMLDYCPADPAAAGAAAGWFRPELRDGELWAVDVRWTERAAAYLRAGEYRYISPAFRASEGGRVESLTNVALTNLPATKNLPALVGADQRRATPTTPLENDMSITPEELEKLRADLAAAQALAEKQAADLERSARLTALDRGVAARKITPAQREQALKGEGLFGKASGALIAAHVDDPNTPAVVAASGPAPADVAGAALTPEERTIARAWNLTDAQMLSARAEARPVTLKETR